MFLLNETLPLSWSFRIPSRPKKGEENEHTIPLPNDLPFTLKGEMKIKNFGNFRRMINDIRLPSFLRLWKQATGKTEIDYTVLEKQFDEYDNGRKEIFRKIHELERLAIKKYALTSSTSEKVTGVIDFEPMIKTLQNISDGDKYLLCVYRNAFLYHYYPEFSRFDDSDGNGLDIQTAAAENYVTKEQQKLISAPNDLTAQVLQCAAECFNRAVQTER
jgi:hypothetical protein